ncbi:hypothetical protein CAEBREN_21270 [Caenorhabditis brenneri]|uniref:Uncharacterized protein n=1 Tax=Caenorhabditis brenneri TaxID=135651 RepID=G0NQK8_CAEBE|nr:hypothetical protein CAEBREN_21270 [Caenorhabditis brenneri]
MSAEAAPVVADAVAPEGMYYQVAGNDGMEFKVSELAIQQSETSNPLVSTMGYTAEDVEKKEDFLNKNIYDEPILKLMFPEYDTTVKEMINQEVFKMIERAIILIEEQAAQEMGAKEAAEKDVQGTNDSA